ncbi:MAG TPA: malonate decarboxylase subunit epsilon [Oxalicibacterium sp.]|nr:malonate decarboxylase subunit epsilon [Oxalicibacterium sp.]
MSVLFTYPGQGSQRPGMLHALPDHPDVRRTLEQAADILQRDPLQLDTPAALSASQPVQLCLLIAGVAMTRVFAAYGAHADMVAGLSIGAYPAAVAAGCLSYEDALQLVALRGRIMDVRYPRGYGMTAILGLERMQLEPLIAQVHADGTPVYLANLNARRQLVIAGTDDGMRAVARLAIAAGASKAERLAVRVPSHCPLFDEEAVVMQQAFANIDLQRPRLDYLSGSNARVMHDPAQIADDLANNLARQVHWDDTVQLAWERGARLAVEMPSNAVLTGLAQAIFVEGHAVSCEGNQLDTLLALIAREQKAQ